MKSFRDYITESETWVDNPAQGDDFDIELAPDEILESYVVDVVEDGIVISGDDRVVSLLESFGHTTETIRRYGPVGSNRGVGFTLEEDEEEEEVEEGAMSDLDIERQDYERMTPQQFYAAYKMSKADWAAKNRDVAEAKDDFGRIMELAGVAEDQDAEVVAQKELAADITNPMPGVHEGSQGRDTVEFDIPTFIRMLEYAREDAKTDMDLHDVTEKAIALSQDGKTLTMDDYDAIVGGTEEIDEDGVDPVNQFGQDAEELSGNMTAEAEYQGRNVELNKPKRGGSKKFYVYVKDPKTGNIRKISFGDPNMKIKKSNPARRKSFRARHRCENPGSKTKARYWACRSW